ncbi:MAG: hybrid non-ribosomal peptide synthetase/type I polyketide synthase [Planctomycetota bacterium]
MIGNQNDYLCTRVSHKLDLHGPSVAVQAACSTSLVAIAQAVESLRAGGCDMALAGGVSVLFPQDQGYLHQEGDISSSDGRCRPFDTAADGTLFGDGIGVVALKRLSDAEADGDPIHAVIHGVAVNNDGAGRQSFSAPSPDGQAAVVAAALADAGWDPASVGMIEAHGTGTPIGDPIEVDGLRRVYGGLPQASCALGSVKSQVGHLIAAAGVTGFIKSVLALERGSLPPTAHFKTAHEALGLAGTPFFVPAGEQPWREQDGPRRAGVSAFGLGGTNAHVLLEQAPALPSSGTTLEALCLPLSAATPEALAVQAATLADHLEAHPEADAAAVAVTLQDGREAMRWRAAVGAADLGEAVAALRDPRLLRQELKAAAPTAAFLFPGGGAQDPTMGHGLIASEPTVRAVVEQGIAWMKEQGGPDLGRLWWPGDPGLDADEAAALWRKPSWQLPAIYLLEVALARLWQEHGVEPRALLGHSMGEYAAACIAGVMSLEEGLGVVATRGRLFETLPEGGMLSVALPEAELRSRLGAELDLGVVNGEELCLASGPVAAIEALETALTGEGIDCARVRIEVAAHSRMVDAILDEFRAYLEGIDLKPPRIPIASNLSGDWLTDEEACSPDYWVRHLRETVRFADGLALVAGDGSTQLIEAGPGRTLSSLAKPALDLERGQQAFASLGHADDARGDRVLWQEAVGRAWCAGLAPDWARLLPRQGVRRLSLPTYAFARTPYLFAIPGGAPAVPDAPVADVAAAPAEEEAPAFDPDLPRLDRVRLRLAMILGQLSGMDPNGMPTDQPFLEMGFDSLFLTQASLAFKRAFGVKVTFRQLFNEAPDLDRLADYIDGELAPDAEVELPLASAVAAGGSTEAAPGQAMVLPALHPEGADPGDKVFRFRPFKPVEKGKDGGLTAQQQAHLDELIEAVTAKTPGSKAATAAHRSTFADPRAVGGFKTMWKEAVYPLHVTRSKGARMWDVDGNEYVDAVGGFGAVFFGHAPDFVVDAVREQAERNLDYGPTSMLAGRLSERFCAMTGMDRVGFCNTGSEAMLAAIRIARTVTGRDRVATFSGAYHGLFDQVLVRAQEADGKRRNVPVAPGIPQQASSNVMVLEYGLPASLELIRAHADELAAVLVEPVQSRAPEIQPFAFVKQLRALTEELGIPLVFDEVITGFRTHPRGAQHYYGVQADIAAYGKVIGGGLPIGMVAGRAEYLDALDGGPWQYGDDSFPEAGVTYFAGTFVRHPLALAAMDAVLDRLEEGGPELQEEVNHRIAGFCAACNDDFEAAGLPLRMLHYASMIYPKWGGDPEFEGLWFQHLRLRGVHIWEGRPGFLTTEHGQAELDFMREAFVAAAEALVEGGFLVREEPADTVEPLLVALTGPQEELWLTTRAAPEASIALNEPCAFRLDGRLHRGVLDRALRKLVERHDALRAAAAPDGSGLVVHPHGATPPVREHDLRGLAPEEQAAARERIYREDSREPFDLEAPPLLRVHLIRLGEREQELLLTVHHLIADGWSISILFHDLAQLYSRMMQGRNETLEEAMPLTEFKAWEVEQRASVEHAETLAFWKGRFATVPEPLELPLDRPRPARRSYAGDRFHVTLEAELGRALQQQASTRKCTLFSLLLAGYLAWLHRLTGRTDLVLGIPSAGQALLGANNLVAHCVHYLPFRLQVDPEESFERLVARVAEEMLTVNEHQDFTFGDLLQELRMPRDASRPTLISVDFNVDPALDGMDFHGLDAGYVSTPRDFARLELQLNVIEEDGHLLLECDYATDILDRATAEQWMADYAALLREVAERPTGTVAALPGPMVARTEAPPSELAAPLDVGPFQGVVARVRAASTADPARIALVDGERKLDYGILMAEVDAWTGALQDAGLEPGQVVALHLGRSLELTVAQLAVWQAGGVCLPLDPAHPLARRAELLERAAATLLVHGHDSPPEAELRAVTTFPIQVGAAPEAAMRAVALDPSMPAYILFTSGSTGMPKGVSIAHGSFDNLLPAFAARPGASADESWLAVITPTFDMSLVEIFVPLTVGARVVLAPADRVLGGPELLALLRAEAIDVVQATPATWRMLLDAGLGPDDALRIIAGGEALTPALAEALRPYARDLWNAYGPTEITVYACAARLDEVGATVPIGLPIANVGLHILGADDRPVAAGETGELCISGAGLALGYLDMPEETAVRFPTLDLGRGPERLYRSGDLARLMPDGQVQCLGRNDDQVKLRGFRIELGEIEAALEALPAVAQAAVALRQDEAGEDLLAAWLRPVGEALPPITELRSALARRLPAAMIPARLHEVDDFPLTSSGKVDRKALVLPRREVAAAVEGEENMEDFLSRLWQAMLGLEELALDDDFFMLGGHSLMAARMLARVEERTGLLLALEEVFRHPTVRGLAATIEATLFQQESPGDGEGREELRL